MPIAGWLVRWTAVTALLPLAACGARSELDSQEEQALTAHDGGPGGTGAGGANGGGGTGGAGAPPCYSWSVVPGEPIALTDPVGDSMLTSAAPDGDRVLVASTNDNDPSPDPTFRVRVVSDDLATIDPSQAVLSRPQQSSYSGMSLAAGSGHRAGIAWDEYDGCRFVALGPDGAASAAPVGITTSWCYWLSPTASGFTAMSSPLGSLAPLTLLTLDPGGNVVGSQPDVVPPDPADTYPLDRARFEDGSTLLAWLEGSSTIRVQRFSETGEALSQPKALPEPQFGYDTSFALGAVGSSALIAWSSGPLNLGQVLIQPIDEDGNALGDPSELAPADGLFVGRIDLVAARGGALVLWIRGQQGAYDTMTVQPVTTDGVAMGGPVTVPTPPFLLDVRLTTTPLGAMVAYDAEQSAPTQVFVSRLQCGE